MTGIAPSRNSASANSTNAFVFGSCTTTRSPLLMPMSASPRDRRAARSASSPYVSDVVPETRAGFVAASSAHSSKHCQSVFPAQTPAARYRSAKGSGTGTKPSTSERPRRRGDALRPPRNGPAGCGYRVIATARPPQSELALSHVDPYLAAGSVEPSDAPVLECGRNHVSDAPRIELGANRRLGDLERRMDADA